MRERAVKVSAVIVVIFLSSLSALAGDLHRDPAAIDLAPARITMLHQASNIQFAISNYGVWGNFYNDCYPINAPSAEFPKGSYFDYLYAGLIWIGAAVENSEDPGALDTLVSIGDDCWWSGVYEFNPGSYDQNSMYRQSDIGDEEMHAEFFDTLVTGVHQDFNDARPHRPLGLKINQTSYCWSSPGYDEFFVITYALENIYDRDLHDVWFGINYCGDVLFNDQEGGMAGYNDDLRGYREYNGQGIGWLADNNGDPVQGAFGRYSPRGVMGLMLLGSSVPDIQTNYNWWVSNVNSVDDWGPQLEANYNGLYPGGGRGTPGGDRAKYRVMSNGEHDYDQAYSALDWTGSGWIPNDCSQPSAVADGNEAMFLLSYGPFELAAGQVETLTFAYFAGHDFHTDPDNYENNLHGRTDDSVSIARYYADLNFSDFLAKADSAIHYYDVGIDKIPIGPPSDFHVANWSANHVMLSWGPREHPHLGEYRIYRGTQPGMYASQQITPDNLRGTIFFDNDIEDTTAYYYIIKSVNDFGIEGAASPEIVFNPGQPRTPLDLTADAGDDRVELSWQTDNEDNITGYIIYRDSYFNDYRGFSIIDTGTAADYIDYDVTIGDCYKYSIRALNAFGYASSFSDTAFAIPHDADLGILLINANDSFLELNPDYDSMAVFYNHLLLGTEEQFAVMDSFPYSLATLANYHTIVWCNELQRTEIGFYYAKYSGLSEYLEAGGNLIVAGTGIINSNYGVHNFSSGTFEHNYLNLDIMENPDRSSDEFTGGITNLLPYPDFNIDTLKANRIVYPQAESNGRIYGLGMLVPRDSSEVIYNYRSVNPDTSGFQGRPIGVIHHGRNFNTALLNFPLYYVEPGLASVIFNQVLQDLDNEYGAPSAPLPERTSLLKNYPNPFNPATTIEYELAKPSEITINIYDILGRRVTNLKPGPQEIGVHSLPWDARNLPSGVYFAAISGEGQSAALKMVLLK